MAAVIPGPAADRRGERGFWLLLAAGAIVLAIGLAAAHTMETAGHIVTGMNNSVVWGTPHVFAIFLIVAASGVLNVASIGTVFGQPLYKARARLSGLLCIAMLAGGLMVLMLDLGRPERVIVAATHYNPTSIFAWNVLLYSGMFALALVYLWTLFERRMARWSKVAGFAAFFWRLILTTGTGSIFGFLVARQAFGSALLAPMFILMSFAWGLAVFYAVQAAIYAAGGRTVPDEVHRRLRNLLGVFIGAVLFMVALHHLTSLYFARQTGFERFILLDGGVYPLLFWLGYVLLGAVLPLVLLYGSGFGGRRATLLASLLVVAGAFVQLYVLIIGGQVYPLELFPGATVSSSFLDAGIAPYAPSAPEVLLGAGGVALALLITVIGLRIFDFEPRDEPVPAAGDARAPGAAAKPAAQAPGAGAVAARGS